MVETAAIGLVDAQNALLAAKEAKKRAQAAFEAALVADMDKSASFFFGPGFALRRERTAEPADITLSRTTATLLEMIHSPTPPPWCSADEMEELDDLQAATETAQMEYKRIKSATSV